MCEEPIQLAFTALGHFNHQVLFGRIEMNEEFERLLQFREIVMRHFAAARIYSADNRPFVPHMTIAKINFERQKRDVIKEIDPNLYKQMEGKYLGFQTVSTIQLLTGVGNNEGYYAGDNLVFKLKDYQRHKRQYKNSMLPIRRLTS
ncbi:unnamed protein product [Larinioides sclopetarius]